MMPHKQFFNHLPWVWISSIALLALAISSVVFGNADWEGWALDQAANLCAGLGPKNCFGAGLWGAAVGVRGTTGDWLANSGELVLGVAWPTLAHWPLSDNPAKREKDNTISGIRKFERNLDWEEYDIYEIHILVHIYLLFTRELPGVALVYISSG